ncbi:MAG TPA: Hpt domain-containing protein [Anaerolineae bacterium]|jgi:histidine phosphotransfer protein HptB|nr:Hpt domain-containing protein [Anaerolineae bacterium]
MADPVIDPTTFQSLIAGTDSAFVMELIDTFLDDAPTMLNDLRQSLAEKNAEVFRRAAHSLKSNSASFGALHLSTQAKELELLGKAGDLAQVGDKLTALTTEFDRVQVALRNWQHGSK